ncbi:unnamed protein product [Gongylonema pulchrum]|uniref:WD_REPEATS_REGION domain-containing protein n=1 Tax=Gongylonema pulchrum TaxID=637853 RepID=A0A183DUD4_9BILA|nr:unnamed protein product [Gongylonema pulchrum]
MAGDLGDGLAGGGDDPMEEYEMMGEAEDDDALLGDEDDIVRVIPLDDDNSLGHSQAPQEISGDEEMQDSDDDDGDEEAGEVLSESQLVRACNDEVYTVTCFRNWLVVGGKNDQAVLYRLDNLSEPILTIDGHKDSVICAEFNGRGRLLATGDMSGLIIVSDPVQPKKCYTIEDCEELSWMKWHFSADILLAGGRNGIWMWLITLDGVQQTKTYFCGSVARSTDGSLLNDGRRLISCYEDGSVRIWSLKDEKSMSITTGAQDATRLDTHHSLSLAIVGDTAGHCFLVSTDTAKVLKVFNVHEGSEHGCGSIECVRFHPGDMRWFAVGTNFGRFAIYDFATGTLRHVLLDNEEAVVDCKWYQPGPGQQYRLIAAQYDGTVTTWSSAADNTTALVCVHLTLSYLYWGGQTVIKRCGCLVRMAVFTCF